MSAVVLYGADGKPMLPSREHGRRGNPTLTLTPKKLQQQLTAFSLGRLAPLARTMDWVEEHDAMTASVVEKARGAVTRHGYEILKKNNIDPSLDSLADDQQRVLQTFYDSIEVGDAEDEDECGGVRLLLKQMMRGFSQRYTAHHLVWTPETHGLKLNATVVPLWYFENTQGRMRFSQDGSGYGGVNLDDLGGESAWMVSKGRGASLAGMACFMFSNIPTLDWVTYCARNGMPGFLGKSGHQKGSAEWESMVGAVYNLAAEFAAVVSGQDSIEVLDLTSKGELPYPKLIELMDRRLAILHRGSDLSTMSKSGGVGASVQDDETAALDEDNAVWLSETLNRNISNRVLEYHFGDAPKLVQMHVNTAQPDDRKMTLEVMTTLADRGAAVPMSYVRKELQIPEAGEGEETLGEVSSDQSSVNSGVQPSAVGELNTAASLPEIVAQSLGVATSVLDPVQGLLDEIEKMAADESLTEDQFLDRVEEVILTMPELFDDRVVELLAESLEESMGSGVVAGVIESLRDNQEG